MEQQQLMKQHLLMRSPHGKESQRSNSLSASDVMNEHDLGIISPTVTEQLNIDVPAEATTEVKAAATTATPATPATPTTPTAGQQTPTAVVPQPTTPSSPLLTSLLRSPTTTSPVSKNLSSSVAAKLSFSLSNPLTNSQIRGKVIDAIVFF